MCHSIWNITRYFNLNQLLLQNCADFFCQAKSTSFRRGQPAGKFQDWLLKDSPAPEVTLSATAWSILSYFAYETVAQIVDLAFIVRRDNTAGQTSDAVKRNTVPRVSPDNADVSKVSKRIKKKVIIYLFKQNFRIFSQRGQIR